MSMSIKDVAAAEVLTCLSQKKIKLDGIIT